MKTMFRKFTILITSVLILNGALLLAAPARSFALFENSRNQACAGVQLSNSPVACDPKSSSSSINGIITTVLDVLSVVVGLIAVVMIIISGLRFVLSGGDSANTNSARNSIIYAIVGLVIVALAQIIVRYVLSRVSG